MCAAFVAAALTLFSGFGLGTLLMPVLTLFFSVEIAIAITAIVHLLNNLLKLALWGRHIAGDVETAGHGQVQPDRTTVPRWARVAGPPP